MVGGGRPLVPEILGQTDPVLAKNADFQSIFARNALAVTPSSSRTVSVVFVKSL